MQNNRRKERGFTLLEVVVGIMILGTAAVIAATVLSGHALRIEEAMSAQNDMLAVSSCLERVKAEAASEGGPQRLLADKDKLTCSNAKLLIQEGTLRRGTGEEKNLAEPYVKTGGELLLVTISSGEASVRYVLSK